MAIRVIDDTKLQNIALAIQSKDGGGKMYVTEMRGRIEALQVGNPYQVMNDYIEDTLTRLRLNNVPSGKLRYIQPGNGKINGASQTIQRIELPNNSDDLDVWQFGNMRNLLFFDSGYTQKFDNVCLNGCTSLMWIVVRKGDSIPTLFSSIAISLSNVGRIAVVPELIEDYKNGTNWSYWADKFRNLYFANSNDELEALLLNGDVPDESMIVCDYNETYYVKGEGIV